MHLLMARSSKELILSQSSGGSAFSMGCDSQFSCQSHKHTHTHTRRHTHIWGQHTVVNSWIRVQLSELQERSRRERDWCLVTLEVCLWTILVFYSRFTKRSQCDSKLKNARCKGDLSHVSMAPCVHRSVTQRWKACLSDYMRGTADFWRETAKERETRREIWVCQLAVSFFHPATAHLKFGTSIIVAPRVLSTVRLTLCRNAGGNLFLYFLLVLCMETVMQV